MNCNENLFDVITSIEAYSFSGVSSTRTMEIHGKYAYEQELGLSDSRRTDVPLKPKSCEPVEKPMMEIPGDSYEVTVTWMMKQVDSITYIVLRELKEHPKHLILRTYNNKGYFIRCEENGYEFSYQEKNGEIECEVSIHNKNGIQRLL